MTCPKITFSQIGQSGVAYSCSIEEVRSKVIFQALGLIVGEYDNSVNLSDVVREDGHLRIFDINIESEPDFIEGLYEHVELEDGYLSLFEILENIPQVRRDYAYITTNGSKWIAKNPYVTYFQNRSFTCPPAEKSRRIYLKEEGNCVCFEFGCYVRGKFRIINDIPINLDTLVSETNKCGIIHLQESLVSSESPARVPEGYTAFQFREPSDSFVILDNIILSLNRYMETPKPKSARK